MYKLNSKYHHTTSRNIVEVKKKKKNNYHLFIKIITKLSWLFSYFFFLKKNYTSFWHIQIQYDLIIIKNYQVLFDFLN